MSRRLAIVLFVLAATFAALFVSRNLDPQKQHPIRRAAFDLPRPTAAERSEFFLDLLASGRTTPVAGAAVPIWNVVGEPSLIEGGTASLDYILSPDRADSYRRSPGRLLNVLAILSRFDGAPDHPQYAPFLQFWLDPRNCPSDTPGNHPAEEIRKAIFSLFLRVPPLWTVPFAQDELVRSDRYHDLRQQALAILLYLGETDAVIEAFPSLPPSPDEPNGALKQFVLFQMRTGASPNQPTSRREGIRRLESLARASLKDGGPVSQINAASTLLRLGDRGMVDVLLQLHATAVAADAQVVAWSALLQLAEDSSDPRLRGICEERVQRDPPVVKHFSYRTALEILSAHWIDELWVRDGIRDYIKRTKLRDLKPLQWLNRSPKERDWIVQTLRGAIRDEDSERRQQAIRFATNVANPIPEVLPDIFDVARKTPGNRGRTRFLNALVTTHFTPVRALLLADLDDELPVLRQASAANLLELGGEEAVAAVARHLTSGDLAVLAPIVARAKSRGRAGIDDALLPAVLETLRHAPSEQERLQALFVIRCRGALDGIRDELMDAYRREPSHRIAEAIREVLVELAYRTAIT